MTEEKAEHQTTEETPDLSPLKEVEAMKEIAEALKGLKPESIQRVLDWASSSFGVGSVSRPRVSSPNRQSPIQGDSPSPQGSDTNHSSLSDFFATIHTDSGAESALVVAYWLQVVQGAEDFEGQTLNDELKHLGHGLSNVTKTLSGLMEQKPALIIQTKKTGKSKQARKRYKVTAAGISKVRHMLKQEHEEQDGYEGNG